MCACVFTQGGGSNCSRLLTVATVCACSYVQQWPQPQHELLWQHCGARRRSRCASNSASDRAVLCCGSHCWRRRLCRSKAEPRLAGPAPSRASAEPGQRRAGLSLHWSERVGLGYAITNSAALTCDAADLEREREGGLVGAHHVGEQLRAKQHSGGRD
jgi:hypothetical protein